MQLAIGEDQGGLVEVGQKVLDRLEDALNLCLVFVGHLVAGRGCLVEAVGATGSKQEVGLTSTEDVAVLLLAFGGKHTGPILTIDFTVLAHDIIVAGA